MSWFTLMESMSMYVYVLSSENPRFQHSISSHKFWIENPLLTGCRPWFPYFLFLNVTRFSQAPIRLHGEEAENHKIEESYVCVCWFFDCLENKYDLGSIGTRVQICQEAELPWITKKCGNNTTSNITSYSLLDNNQGLPFQWIYFQCFSHFTLYAKQYRCVNVRELCQWSKLD